MSDIYTGGGASIGGDAKTGAFTGRDDRQQHVRIDLGSRSPAELQRIVDIVLGDGLRWDGVVREIRNVEDRLTKKISAVEQRIDDRLSMFEKEFKKRPNIDYSGYVIVWLIVALILLAIAFGWIAYTLANGGVVA